MKISVDKTMQDIVSIKNQISGLELLLDSKKAVMAKYFDKTGERTASNDECTVFVSERTTIDYDVAEIKKKLDKSITSQFLNSTYTIRDWLAFVAFCKKHNITPDELRPFISVKQEVNQEKLSKLYEKGTISLADLEGCYTAVVKQSVVLRMKNVDKEIPVRE